MPLEDISIPSPRDTIVREIESQIIRGKLRPGEKLPTERELAAQTSAHLPLMPRSMVRSVK